MAEACCQYEIRKRSVLIDQALNLWPTPIGQHAELFAEGSTEINRKAGRVNLPQPMGLQWSPS